MGRPRHPPGLGLGGWGQGLGCRESPWSRKLTRWGSPEGKGPGNPGRARQGEAQEERALPRETGGPAQRGAGGSDRGRRQGAGWGPGDAGGWRGHRVWALRESPSVPSSAHPRGSPLLAGARSAHPTGGRRRGGGCARRRRRESGLGCSRRLALALRRARRRRRSGAASPRPSPRRPARSPRRGRAAGTRSGGTASHRRDGGRTRAASAGSGPATEESPVGERASSRRLPQTWAGLGVGGRAPRGPDCRTPGAARGDGAWSETARFAECRCASAPGTRRVRALAVPALLQAGPGGRGDAREFGAPAGGGFILPRLCRGLWRGVCEGHSVGLFTWRPLRAHGVCWRLENQAVMLAFVSQASACAIVQVRGRAPLRLPSLAEAVSLWACVPCVCAGSGALLALITERACQSGCWGECGGVAVVCQWVNVRVHMGK